MKERFEEILKQHNLYGDNVEDIISAVRDMLLYVADDTKERYPYATNSIHELEEAAYQVSNLTDGL